MQTLHVELGERRYPIFIGSHLMNYKKTLPDGSQVYNYCETDKVHGRNILYISTVSFSISAQVTF